MNILYYLMLFVMTKLSKRRMNSDFIKIRKRISKFNFHWDNLKLKEVVEDNFKNFVNNSMLCTKSV